jgi:hypothetical protein
MVIFSLLLRVAPPGTPPYDPGGSAGNPWELGQRSGVLNMRITKSRLANWPGLAARMLALLAGSALVASLVAATGNTAAAGLAAAQGRAGASRPAVLTPAVQWGSCPATIPAQFRCATEPVPLNYQHPAGQRPGDGAAFPVDVRQGVDRAGQEVFLDRFLPLCAEAGSACAFSSGGNLRAKWRTLLARAQAGQLS